MFAASKTAGAVSAAPPASSDPQFNYVSLLLNDTGTNGQQNNTFLDSSSNNFTITRNGTPTQGSVTPYWPDGQWSNYFSVSQKLTIGAATNNNISTGDFTIEGWICFSDISTSWTTYNPSNQYIFDIGANGSYFSWRSDTGGRWVFQGTGLTNPLTYTNVPVVNTWYHFAITRSGNTFRLFINGDLKDTQTNTGTLSSSSWNIGSYGGAGNYGLSGYLSNFRVVKGTALYTSNFTPSTTPLTAVSGTSLLTCQSNRFKDNSSNNFAITVTGTPTVQAFEPFEPASSYGVSNGGSGYFGGSGQFLTAPASTTAWAWGTSSYTIELWVYPTDLAVNRALIAKQQSTSNDWEFYLTSGGAVAFRYWNGSQQLVSTAGSLVATNRWTHIAFVNNAGAITIYVNGVSSATGTVQSGWNNGNLTLKIGQAQFGTSPSDYLGYMSNVRLVNGTAVYTAAFTPPTSPVTAITGTSLLLNCTNAGIYDAATLNDLVTVNDAKVSTAQAKFGSSSMAFDGTGDYLSALGSDLHNLPGNFTVECWVYISGTGTQRIVGKWNGAGGVAWILQIDPASFVEFGYANSGTFGGSVKVFTATGSNTWKHVAVTRSGTTIRIFVNGVQAGSGTVSSNLTAPNTNALTVGQAELSNYLNGYIDDLRITKGYARYTANFTPPTAPFPTR